MRDSMKVLLAWTPLFILWTLFTLSYTDGNIAEAAASGLINSAIAAALGLLVWRWTGWFTWPENLSLRFVLAQIVAGAIYALIWICISIGAGSLINDVNVLQQFAETSVSWRFLTSFWIYGCTAAICYALRIQKTKMELEVRSNELELLVSQSALQSLRAQLNPHFMFNALHAISGLIAKDATRAEQAVCDIGDMMRYVLRESEALVTLADEMAFTDKYCATMNLRLDSPPEIDWRIQTEAEMAELPRLTVQPLVENIYRHAHLERSTISRIEIRADVRDGMLLLSVNDTGAGTTKPVSMIIDGNGGLSNLRKRLRLIYGDLASLHVWSPRRHGFRVDLSIPKERMRALEG